MKKVDVYTIDTGVPVPEDGDNPVPINRLEVGESILFPLSARPTVQSRATHYKKRQGKVFVVKKQSEDTARIWRKA